MTTPPLLIVLAALGILAFITVLMACTRRTAGWIVASVLKEPQTGAAENLEIGGRPSIRQQVSGGMDGSKLAYQVTLIDGGNTLCQVIGWTLLRERSSAFPEFDKISATFEIRPRPALGGVSDNGVTDELRTFIAEQLGVEKAKVTPQSRLVADLGADDLDMIELVMLVEEEFNLQVSDEDAMRWATAGDVIEYVERHHAPRKASLRK